MASPSRPTPPGSGSGGADDPRTAPMLPPFTSGTIEGQSFQPGLGMSMDSLRLAPADSVFPKIPCGRCGDNSRWWDRVSGKTYCPNCLEALALGEADPLVVRTDRRRCAVCHHEGTIRYLTFPLHSRRPVEVDLCAEHVRAIVARRLGDRKSVV